MRIFLSRFSVCAEGFWRLPVVRFLWSDLRCLSSDVHNINAEDKLYLDLSSCGFFAFISRACLALDSLQLTLIEEFWMLRVSGFSKLRILNWSSLDLLQSQVSLSCETCLESDIPKGLRRWWAHSGATVANVDHRMWTRARVSGWSRFDSLLSAMRTGIWTLWSTNHTRSLPSSPGRAITAAGRSTCDPTNSQGLTEVRPPRRWRTRSWGWRRRCGQLWRVITSFRLVHGCSRRRLPSERPSSLAMERSFWDPRACRCPSAWLLQAKEFLWETCSTVPNVT